MSGISTHVLDLARGDPAAGILVVLEMEDAETGWREVGAARTDEDGRIGELLPEGGVLRAGTYRLRFRTGAYFEEAGVEGFHPHVEIAFAVREPREHHHIPLLLSPFGYTTYRGS